MPRSRRQVQQRVVRQVPTGDEMVNSLLNEDIPRIHAEVADDWQPAFDTAGFGSQIAPPAQPSPAAPAPSAPVAAEDAAVAEDPSARLTDWDRANWDIGFPLGSTVPRVNETQVSQASVADALSQVAGGDLDSRMSSSYEGTSGLDEYLSEQAQQGEQRAGQFDSDKGKQEDLGLVGGAKDESKPQTEYEMAQQSAWEAAPAAISSGVIGALGELFGSADYRAQNRGWGQRAAALIDDRVTRDRSFRNREQAAFDRRAGIRGNIEERLGASKEAAQLADPGSEQSQRLQNMYSVRLAMAAPGVEASSLRDYLSNLAYSDEASRQALDGVLESAEKLRSEGRALQQEELIALMNAAVSLRRTDRTAMARENSARNSGGGGGGGNRDAAVEFYVAQNRRIAENQGIPYTAEQEQKDREFAALGVAGVGLRNWQSRSASSGMQDTSAELANSGRLQGTLNMNTAVQSGGIPGLYGWRLREGAAPLTTDQVKSASGMGKVMSAVPAARAAARYLAGLSDIDRAAVLSNLSSNPVARGHVAAIANLQDAYRQGQGMGAPQAAELVRLEGLLPTNLMQNPSVLINQYRSVIGAVDEIDNLYSRQLSDVLGLERSQQEQARPARATSGGGAVTFRTPRGQTLTTSNPDQIQEARRRGWEEVQ